MKILIPLRHGLGDVLHILLHHDWLRMQVAKARLAKSRGIVTELLCIYEEFMNPAIAEIIRSLIPEAVIQPTKNVPWVHVGDSDNRAPDRHEDYWNLFTKAPSEVNKLPEEDAAPFLPVCVFTKPASFDQIPKPYIALNPLAGEADRQIYNQSIIDEIKRITGCTIVLIGKNIPRHMTKTAVTGDVNLIDKLSLLESLYVCEHSQCIISTPSFLRAFAKPLQKRVIEILDTTGRHSTYDRTIKRTKDEYDRHIYGTNPVTNAFFPWPAQKGSALEEAAMFGRDWTVDLKAIIDNGSIPGADGTLGQRHVTVSHLIRWALDRDKPLNIIETGTSHNRLLDAHGMMTVILAALASKVKGNFTSVDIDPVCTFAGNSLIRKYSTNAKCVNMNSLDFIKSYPNKIDILYLDSYDFTTGQFEESRKHHLKEIELAFPKLNKMSLVLVDDSYVQRWFPTKLSDYDVQGKSPLVHDFLLKRGYTCLYDVPNYQRLYTCS